VSSGLYFPLVLIGVAYAGLSIAAGMAAGRGDAERGERFRDLAFGAALGAAAYTAVLLILAAVDTPERFTDAVTIIFVVCVFFVLLLLVLFFIAQGLALLRRRPGR
jgi:hypothetical protein